MKKIIISIFVLMIFFIAVYLVIDFPRKQGIESCSKDLSSNSEETHHDKNIQALKSLPYVSWAPIDDDEQNNKSVITYNPNLAFKGVNLYCSRGSLGGCFVDMNGNVLHEFVDKREKKIGPPLWHLMEPYLGTDFLVIIENFGLFRIDWQSNVKWNKRMRAHHDIAIADNGDIYTLSMKRKIFPGLYRKGPITDNKLLILSGDGSIKHELSFSKMVLKNKELIKAIQNKKQRLQPYLYDRISLNIFHANTLEIIKQDIVEGSQKVFKKGNILFCLRNLDIVGVFDIEKEEILWYWGIGELDCPHNPSLLSNGNILIFDNGAFRKYSRVVELNPVTEEIEWEYTGTPLDSFYSTGMCSAQRLPNGNTLITEAQKGYVFEITRNKEVVWEFFNPEILSNAGKFERAGIYRMVRLIDFEHYPFHAVSGLPPK